MRRNVFTIMFVTAIVMGGFLESTPASASVVLYNQNNHDGGGFMVSQNFVDFSGIYDNYDSQGADDFRVPKGETWTIQTVIVTGVYSESSSPGPAFSENVTIYNDAAGTPGTVVTTVTVKGLDTAGSFSIPVGSIVLTKGRYWLSVQANMAYDPDGFWSWESRTDQRRSGAVWRNPGDGFHTGCIVYKPVANCLDIAPPDFMFKLKGALAT